MTAVEGPQGPAPQRAASSGGRPGYSKTIPRPEPTSSVSHWPDRPSWRCSADGRDWPCDVARVELAEAYAADRVGLATYLSVLLGYASAEAGTALASELHERFIAWTR